MSLVSQIMSALAFVYVLSFVYVLMRNIVNGRRTGLPILIVPFDQNHIIWVLIGVPLRPHLKRLLPDFVFRRLTLSIYGWEFHEKLRPYQQRLVSSNSEDKSFILAGCGKLEFWTRDAETAYEVLQRPRDFVQLDLSSLFMARFGHNVLTTNGDRWARQRKIVASVINERISKAVFEESIQQTEGMLREVFEHSHGSDRTLADTNKLFDFLKKVTIHVLSGAGMGARVTWQNESGEKPPPGFRLTYIESVKSVIHNVTGPMLLPRVILSNWPSFLPGHENLKTLGTAVEEFPKLTTDMLDKERQRARVQKEQTRNNIMSQMLQASEQPGASKTLTEEELLGNLFVFTGAGFDTTANTLAYAMVLLARYPKWQEWLIEEIDDVLPKEQNKPIDYTSVFPRATRTLAYMFETLRLFTPLVHISKMTKVQQTIPTARGRVVLPAETTVYINAVALHLDENVWRGLNMCKGQNGGHVATSEKSDMHPDEFSFRPSRWINPEYPNQLFQPPKGAFLPWSAGPRVCPGQKMAQVEFVAIFLRILRECRVEAVPLENESRAAVETRLDAMMKNSISILTLQMNGVYEIDGTNKDTGLMLRLCRRN